MRGLRAQRNFSQVLVLDFQAAQISKEVLRLRIAGLENDELVVAPVELLIAKLPRVAVKAISNLLILVNVCKVILHCDDCLNLDDLQ